jgi:hypothetical protein
MELAKMVTLFIKIGSKPAAAALPLTVINRNQELMNM